MVDDSDHRVETFSCQKRKRMKAQLMDDGPRQKQKTLLNFLWIGKGRHTFFFSLSGRTNKILVPPPPMP